MCADRLQLCDLRKLKENKQPVVMVTAYDYPTGRLADEAGVDCVLVGDSLSNVVLGYPDTVPVTMDEMLHHVKAVTRAVRRAVVIADMPFLSFQVSPERAIENAGRFLKEGLAQAVKVEGGGHLVPTVAALVRAGIPTVGHLGLTPQTAALLGGYHVQGKTARAAHAILEDAWRLEQAGISLLVLECVPDRLAGRIASELSVPVIGIGAGAGCDGQVLVFHDLLGITFGFAPRFLKTFAEAGRAMREGLAAYAREVRERTFPAPEHAFSISDEEWARLDRTPRGEKP